VATKGEKQAKQLTSAESAQLAQRLGAMKANLLKSLTGGSSGDASGKSALAGQSQVVVEPEDLDTALRGLNPSLSPSERARFEDLYRHFLSSHDGTFTDTAKEAKKTSLM